MNIESVTDNIYKFGVRYPDFFDKIVSLVKEYDVKQQYGVNYRQSDLFRILSEREREPRIPEEEYERMKEEVYSLKLDDFDAYEEFKQLIRNYAVRSEYGIGYTTFISCLYDADEKICRKSKSIANKLMRLLNDDSLELVESALDKIIIDKGMDEGMDDDIDEGQIE